MPLDSPASARETDSTPSSRSPAVTGPLVLVALILLALNLRSPITSVAPLLGPLQSDLRLSTTAVGVLTSLPVLCLGLFAFIAPGLGRRWSLRVLLTVSLVVLTVGALVRSGTSATALFVGTVLVAAPISVANVLIPGLIKRRFPRSVPRVSAFYSSALTFGAAAGPAVAVPLAGATGSSWRTPLLILVVPLSVLTALVVLFTLGKENPQEQQAPASGGRSRGLWRDRLAWQVTVFFGVQSLLSYTVFGWLPSIWQDRGMSATSAGLALSLCNAVGVVAAWVLAAAGRRLPDQRPAGVTVACLTACGLLGVVLGPKPLLWPSVAVLGLGIGAGFALALSLFALRAPDPATTAALSAMGQGIGYLIGVIGPLGAGALHDVTGTWTWPLALLLLACAAQITVAFSAGRSRTVAPLSR